MAVGYLDKAVRLKAVVLHSQLCLRRFCRTGSKAPLFPKAINSRPDMIILTLIMVPMGHLQHHALVSQLQQLVMPDMIILTPVVVPMEHLLHHQVLPLDVVMVMVPMELELRLEQVVYLQLQALGK